MRQFLGQANRLMWYGRAALANLRHSERQLCQPSCEASIKKAFGSHACNISSASRAGEHAELLRFLSSEMVLVRDEYKSRKAAKKGIPNLAPFSIKDSPGLRHVLLHRTYGKEDITIRCRYEGDSHDKHASREIEEDEYDQAKSYCQGLLHMNVKVSKGSNNPTLEIDCTFAGKDTYFERIACGDTHDKQRHSYAGPRSRVVADELQRQFEQFLAVRGITLELALEVVKEMANKDDREYFRWLKNVRSFVKE
ncbi:hypothetical protein O6H91_03G021000 [Diphasiastrum complanatum]|uniref:Uncharacterized protein n=1 Tax=Diphasiastrum complanatum TaxID=34168 RepID=A0ACC2E412_DIPCM|nr:hypothetical protein O6H91_03G021000 [Diphasiastrum complanatum]